MTRRYWLSFCDDTRPKGDQFVGVCLVEVSEEEAAAMVDEVAARFPHHKPGAEWVAAATRKSWQMACNPGGEMACLDVTDHHDMDAAPLYRLLSKADLKHLALIGES